MTKNETSSKDHSHHADQGHHAHQGHGAHVAGSAAPAPAVVEQSVHEHGAHTHGAGHGAGHDPHAGHVDHSGHEIMFRNRFWVSLILTIPVLIYSPMIQMWFGFAPPAFPGSEWIAPVFAAIIFVYGGVPFLQMAIPEVRARKPGMMVLISLAITVAFFYSLVTIWIDPHESFFWEMALLIVVMLLGHWLEMRSVRQASGALDELAKLMPDTAERVRADGSTEVVAVGALQVGDIVLVRPGATIPADGEVIEGASGVNEAMLTGESRSVKKQPGDRVIAGAINGDGSLRVRVGALGEATALAGIMRLVADAQASKSPAQLLADKAAGWLFYLALAVAALTAIGWTIAEGWQLDTLRRVATVLVIACPHALGLAIPLVVAISTSLGARNGILVRNRLALEDARNVDTVIFDKTGTLTTGVQGLEAFATLAGTQDTGTQAESDAALALAAAVEGDSEHAIGKAIREAAAARGLTLPRATGFTAIQGRGVRANVAGEDVSVGGPNLLEMVSASVPNALEEFVRTHEGEGKSVIYLVQGGHVTAAFAIADVVRPESKRAVEDLQEMGVAVGMLTGDSEAVATAVAGQLGIDRVHAEVLPDRKDRAIVELQEQGHRVAMVGDGVNDAPALTRADVGIAIGGGTDVAVGSADVVLVGSDPQGVAKVIRLSDATHRKMVQNLWWASGYNLIALPVAAGVLAPWGISLSPAMGALLMSISTIVVALNAQLLRRTVL